MSTKIATLYAEITADTSKLETGLKNTKTGLSGIATGFAAAGAAAAMLTTAYFAVSKAVDMTVGEFVKQANAVRTLTQINGQNAQSNSRLIETLDDYKVSTEEAIVAQRKLSTQRETLDIPTLGKLSDAYLKLNSGAERQAFLTANFGRNSAGWAEVMTQGSKAITDRAAAVEKGLILDQRQLDLARKLEFQQDAVNDSAKAAKIAIGEILTPALIALNNQTVRAVAGWQELIYYFELSKRAANADQIKRYTADIANLRAEQTQLVCQYRLSGMSAEEFNGRMATLNDQITGEEKSLQKLNPVVGDYQKQTDAASDATDGLSQSMALTEQQNALLSWGLGELTKSEYDAMLKGYALRDAIMAIMNTPSEKIFTMIMNTSYNQVGGAGAVSLAQNFTSLPSDVQSHMTGTTPTQYVPVSNKGHGYGAAYGGDTSRAGGRPVIVGEGPSGWSPTAEEIGRASCRERVY
jgi:hypothetical protein